MPTLDTGRAALHGALIVLRGRARNHPGKPFTSDLGAFSVAWQVAVDADEELLAFRGTDGTPPYRTAILAALDAIPDGLVPVDRQDTRGGFLFTLRPRAGCRRCGWPIDAESKFEAAETCAECTGGRTRCRRCGKPIPDRGAVRELCPVCMAGAPISHPTQREEAPERTNL